MPFSVQSISAQFIQNTAANNSTEALKYAPTIYNNTGGSQITPYFTVRGFTVSTWTYNMALDGMRSFDIWQPMEDKEQIDIMSGATSFLYGINSTGGVFHYALKRPLFDAHANVTLGRYDQQFYTHADFGGLIGGREEASYRINLGYGALGHTGVDNMTQARYVFSGALAWKAGANTRFDLDFSAARREVEQPQALFVASAASGIPKPPDARINFGTENGNTLDVTRRIGLGLESRLNNVFTLRAQTRHSDDERRYMMSRQNWQNGNLDYRWRMDGQERHHRRATQFNLFLDVDFATGPVRHKLTLGGARDVFAQGYNGQMSSTMAGTHPGNLYSYHPVIFAHVPNPGSETAQDSAYTVWMLSHRLQWGERLELMLGETLARVEDETKTRSVTGGVTRTRYDKQKATPAIALSFKPARALTAYVSYTAALQQGGVSAAAGNPGKIFAPYVGRQTEIGLKATLGSVDVALARFDITQANMMVENDIATDNGRARHKGWEFSFSGQPLPRLALWGGFTVLKAEVKRATNAATIGKSPQGTPGRMARFFAEYELPFAPGLFVNGGLSHTSKVPVDAGNTLYVDPVVVSDIGSRYQHRLRGMNMTLRLNVSNAGSKRYWATRSGMLYSGSPRIVSFSATLDF
ncbi:MAG: TonB-dependent siderophore receptor [Azoarcus sp.]|nr:TonB-dependent siderophore receptor [Azoarcus sp.]